MPKLRRLSGRQVVQILEQFRFSVVSQRGSHMKLKRRAATRKSSFCFASLRLGVSAFLPSLRELRLEKRP